MLEMLGVCCLPALLYTGPEKENVALWLHSNPDIDYKMSG